MSWSRITLGDVVEIKHGFAFKSQYFSDDGEYVVLTPGNFNEEGGFRLRPGKARFYLGDIPKAYVLEAGDLIVAMTEQGPGLLGSSALIPENGKYLHNQRLGLIHNLDQKRLDKRFLYYLFNTRIVRGQISGSATGTKVRHTAPDRIYRVNVSVPSDTSEQKKIAGILSAYDDLIENIRRRIQLLERTARLLYKEWFVHLRFPGHEHAKIKDGVPEGWKNNHLSELVVTQYGFTETATAEPIGPRFLRGKDINKASYIDWSTVPYCPEDSLDFSKYALKFGDIVVIRMADPGRVAIVETEEKAVFASYLVRLTRKAGVDIPNLYLFYVLSGDAYQGFISAASGGATRKSASAKLLVDFCVLNPSALLARAFVDQVQPLRQQIQALLRQTANLKKARDLLLPRLMNGEVSV